MAEKQKDKPTVRARAERYLVQPADPRMATKLREEADVNVVQEIQPKGQKAPILVIEMPPTLAARLADTPDLLVEADHPLRYGVATLPVIDPGVAPLSEPVSLVIQVQNVEGGALAHAAVHVFGEQTITQGLTDAGGRVTLPLSEQDVTGAVGVYVQPRGAHWSAWRARPLLSAKEPNRIACAAIDPQTVERWAPRAMGFDRLPPTFRGHGVKIGIIDSGVDTDGLKLEQELVGWGDNWNHDVVGFGTSAVAIIAELAPEAQLHVCRVSPSGRFGDLVAALDHCVAEQVDLVLIGPGSPYSSWILGRKLEEAYHAGIACVAAAGNTSGPVSFPACLPGVLSVGAIGKVGTFPPDSYHTTQLTGALTPDGFFAARLSASGPELDLCAPGVGVVANETVLDGTTVAASHVSALASLVLAHHPEFRNGFRVRGPGRVERLFDVLRGSCRPLQAIDPMRVGAGMPDAIAAVGLMPAAQSRPSMMHGSGFEGRTRDIKVLHAAMVSAGLAR